MLPARQVLEIAPDHGRISRFLAPLSRRLVLVDLAPNCIAACRQRFAHLRHLEYHVNDGRSLPMVAAASIDAVVSFDSLVHAGLEDARDLRQVAGERIGSGWNILTPPPVANV